MTVYICNSLSLSMLDRQQQALPHRSSQFPKPRIPRPLTLDEARAKLALAEKNKVEIRSAVGHADTAAIFSTLLGRRVDTARVSVKLTPTDAALVGQYIGPRLPEGATALPEGATIEWWLV